jgi:hypothetical protein
MSHDPIGVCQEPQRMKSAISSALKNVNRVWPSAGESRYYLVILACYFIGFLLLTPIGRFNPEVPAPGWYSLSKIERWDDTAYYMVAKSLIVDGDLDYWDELLYPEAYCSLTPNGNPVQGANVPVGSSILWAPFIFLGHLLTKFLNSLWQMNLPENGYSTVSLALTCIGSSLYAFLSLILSFKVLSRYFSPKVALLSVLTVFMGNTLFYNAYIRMLMSHSPEVFSIALFMLLFQNATESGKTSDYLAFGLASGLMVIVRYDNTIFFLIPLAHIASSIWFGFRDREYGGVIELLRNYSLAVLVSLAVVLPQFLHFYIQSGSFLPRSLEGELGRVFSGTISIKDLLFGETRNIVWGQPIIAIGAIGLLFFIKQKRLVGIALFAIICWGILWLFWRPHFYWWGMDFGIRHLIKLSLPLAIGYAAIIASCRFRGKTAFFIGVSLAIVVWEYFKVIQIPKITAVLHPSFLTEVASKIPGLFADGQSRIMMGMEGSYLSVLCNYCPNIDKFNVNDWLYLVFLPVFVLVACIMLVWVYLSIQYIWHRSHVFRSFSIAAVLFFFGALSIFGFLYPDKSDEQIYLDFKNGGILAFFENKHAASLNAFRQALSIQSQGDNVINSFLFVLNNKIEFPFVLQYPEFDETLSAIAACSNLNVVKAANSLIKEIKFVKEGHYDLGAGHAERFLKSGWRGEEGPYPGGWPTFAWAIGSEAQIEVYMGSITSDKVLSFRGKTFFEDQTITIAINGKEVTIIDLRSGWNEYKIRVAAKDGKVGKNVISFKFNYPKSPSIVSKNGTANLAVAFDWLKLEDCES